ncbi:MAG: hypothetical protein IJ877_08480 [Candidatus Gastranaerophilales bacterium]|nr:hypothetical protein [Candidatus Gastranaerophilales bacterium]
MTYKNDHALTIANKWGAASSSAKAELYETYDRLRDLTVSGSTATGSGFGSAGGFLWQLANLFSPSAFMPVMGGSSMMNIPGTSYWSPNYATNSYFDSATHSFGVSGLSSYSGFPSGASSIDLSFLGGSPTGGAAGLATGYAVPAAGIAAMNSASYAAGATSGFGFGQNILLPVAGLVSGWGGILQSIAPYTGEFGLGAIVAGNLMQGTSNAAIAAYQNITGNITNNADVILEDKIRNIETICKMLDTQADIVRQTLKSDMESDSKLVDEL